PVRRRPGPQARLIEPARAGSRRGEARSRDRTAERREAARARLRPALPLPRRVHRRRPEGRAAGAPRAHGVSSSYWLEEPSDPRLEPRLDGRVDVTIVGGGVTGCACARVLAEAGLRVRLHEARHVAEGASGRNGGFALRGGAAPYDVSIESIGRDRAAGYWRSTEQALDRIESLAGDAFERTGSLRLAADEEERDELRAEYELLREDDFAAEWRDQLAAPLHSLFAAAIFHPVDAALQPARCVRRLAGLAAEAGAEIREQSR